MPNTGRPSTGCFRCKRLKMSCDKTRPACKRCIRTKNSCPGYGPAPDMFRPVVFGAGKTPPPKMPKKNTSDSMANSRTRKTDPARRKRASKVSDSSIILCSSLTQLQPSTSILDWCNRSIKLFFWTNTLASCQSDQMLSSFLGGMEGQLPIGEMPRYLEDSLYAAALANMSNRVDLPMLKHQAALYRGSALQALRKALNSQEECDKNELLIALILIERLELIDPIPESGSLCLSHTGGISTVLRMRGDSIFKTETGRQLFRSVNPQLAARDFGSGTMHHLPPGPPEIYPGREREFMILTSNVAVLFNEFLSIFHQDLSAERQLQLGLIVERAYALKAVVHIWHQSLCDTYPSIFARIPSLPPSVSVRICSINDAIAWAACHHMKLRILRMLKRCLPALGLTDTKRYQELDGELLQELNGVAETVPVLLGDVTVNDGKSIDGCEPRGSGVAAMWAMYACNPLAECPVAGAEGLALKQYAIECYNRIGHEFGIKQAFVFRDLFSKCGTMEDLRLV